MNATIFPSGDKVGEKQVPIRAMRPIDPARSESEAEAVTKRPRKAENESTILAMFINTTIWRSRDDVLSPEGKSLIFGRAVNNNLYLGRSALRRRYSSVADRCGYAP